MWKTLERSCHCSTKLIIKRDRTLFQEQLAQHSCLKIKESEIEFQESSKSHRPKGIDLIMKRTLCRKPRRDLQFKDFAQNADFNPNKALT